MTNAERVARQRLGNKADRIRCIAILDMETDPFDPETKAKILPFVAEIYSDQFGKIVIWDEDFSVFVQRLHDAIIALPDSYTIYAHNGGKFDFMFIVSQLRGVVKFKGRAIMSARIGRHELRDSLHILPEKLASWKKDHFDYAKMRTVNRARFRDEILAYLHSDCIYLFDFVKSFAEKFGLKLSIGQAAFSGLKQHYRLARVTEQTDEFLRRYFFGGRVECIAGMGQFDSARLPDGFKLYDVNSMYPHVMAHYKHPIGNEYNWRRGMPDVNTVFIDVECVNHGALIFRADELGAIPGNGRGRYYTTLREFDVAMKHGLLDEVEIKGVVDCREQTDFSKFIVPMYEQRQVLKARMEQIRLANLNDYDEMPEYQEAKKEDLFLKYLLNNAYGKTAQNPRKFKEYYYTDPDDKPDSKWMEFLNECDMDTYHKYSVPIERAEQFSVWAKPSPNRRFNNVGTGASITGTARAILLDAIYNSVDPLYCDTDSLICRDLRGFELSQSKLGAWKLEQEFDSVIILGKKTYAALVKGYPDGHDKRIKVRCKGASGLIDGGKWRGFNWRDFERALDGEILTAINNAPTMTRAGEQSYLTRRIRATAPRMRQGRIIHARGISDYDRAGVNVRT